MSNKDSVSTVAPLLSVIVPCYNEADNVEELTHRLAEALQDISWEVIFVDDDSPDKTSQRVADMAFQDPRVRLIHRIGRRGLSSACVEGMLSSSAPYLAVIDADLQHDETLLPDMLTALRSQQLDIVVGSRYIQGGGIGAWDAKRAAYSRFATRISRYFTRTELSDPMSGFFMIRREALMQRVRRLSGMGFKILLDLFASSPTPMRFLELPYTFKERHAGESKLDNRALLEFGMLLLDKWIGHLLPVRFVAFALVGGIGVLVHFLILLLLFRVTGGPFAVGQAIATLVAMTTNYLLNNLFTYNDIQLKGWKLLTGWFSFILVCGVGAAANVGISSLLFQRKTNWILSALAGIAVSSVWNYAVTAVYTWRAPSIGTK
ncbi:MAG: glycosyltransferase family 2 protein [Candidatus Electrothrix aestuarii]|uniref:Glycosyltransferase family 2 protein n=1 Tax=Candidatus Electrothrix aestuarii TaxID=3062594 RepID=A0AAU8LQZ6_9BACT|nr:glycosyltransferase family 2 protein [Candidatus Electrothrix aestuarii]